MMNKYLHSFSFICIRFYISLKPDGEKEGEFTCIEDRKRGDIRIKDSMLNVCLVKSLFSKKSM